MLNGRNPVDVLRHLRQVLEEVVTVLQGYRPQKE